MDQWLSSILSVFARDLVCGAVDQFRYPCCFNNFVEELEEKEEKLIETRNKVKDRVKHVNKQAIRNDVLNAWLDEASPVRENMEDLLRKARTDKSCCFGHCPDWISRYHLGKKLAEKKVQVEKCIDEGRRYIQFERVASLSVSDMQNVSLEKCLKFDSRKYAYEKLIEALKDDGVTMIGLYGMAGSGKTTMVMELVRIVEAEHLFDKVLFIPVSSKVEVRKIQDKIASVLQFHFPEDGDRERAQRLWTRLTLEEERTLVIMDDVWQLLDFGDIGVPMGENNKSCKILITTRSEAVCTLMDCQRIIHLSILTSEESWELFQKQAHMSEGTSNTLKQLGRQISNKCKGLPVAIVALASTLKAKPEDEWKVALDRLRSSIPVNIEKGLQNPYTCIQVSYDNLDTKEAKSLFLLCSVFPEDFEIPVETLIRIAIGLGLVGEVRSFEGARNEVNAAKNKLISCCLLSISYDGEHVKMHDLVRDVALRIANNENKVVKCALELRDVDLKCTSISYLWCRKFPNDLDCSSIEFLCIKTDLHISDEVFEGMVRLKVLFLSWEGNDRRQLSFMSFKLLTNLRCMSLEWWELADISFAAYMKKLESLTLHLCSFFELPDFVIAQLTNLRLLHLSKCDIKKNPFEVIGRHPLVEELYFYEWGFDNGDHTEFFKKFSVPQALRRYQIKLGPGFEDCEEGILNAHRTLILSCFDTSNAVIVDLAEKAEVLLVANIKGGGKNIIPDIFQIEKGGGVMNYGWIELWLCDSESIVCLVDTRNHDQEVRTLLFELRKLRIERMENLGALYHGVLPSGLFEKLEQLYIYKCPLLTCLFIPAVARNLVHLEKLEIVSCDGLKHVLQDDDETEDDEISREDDMLIFSKLKQLHISGCLMLEYTIPVTFAEGLVELESLEIYECYEMKYVFGQQMHRDQGQNNLKIELPALEKLRLTSNSNMISIFPECCCAASWPSLHEFYLWDCPEFNIDVNTFNASRWEDVRDIEKHFITSETLVIYNSNVESIFSLEGLHTIGKPVKLRLQYLQLSYLYQMKCICVGLKNTFTFQNLKTLEIYGCQKVEVIFPTSVLRCLPELERLEITECQELKQIIEDDDVENQRFSNFVSAQPCFPKLAALVINECHNLERLFCDSVSDNFPNLELLIIWGATKLEELIGYGDGQGQGVDQMQRVKVELPKLKLLVLTYLSSLSQEIELPTVTLRVVHNCTKLSLTSSFATLQEFEGKLSELEKDLEVDEFYRWKLLKMVGENIKSNQVFVSGDTRVENTTEDATAHFHVGPEDQASCSEVCETLSFDIEGGLGKKFDGQVTYSHIPTVLATSSAELNQRPSTSHLDFTALHNAHSHREVEERATSSFNAGLLTLSTHSESARRHPNLLFNSEGSKSYQHTKIRLCQTEIYIDNESEGHPINIKESEDDSDDPISLFQAIEDHYHGTEDNFVVKVILELEKTLKMPLKDIASSEATILHLLTALKFLSQLPLEDVTLSSSGLKTVIESLHHEFPSILCSFKQAFFAAVPEEQERSIKEELISHPKNEVAGKAEMPSIHGGKKKCIVETKGFKREFDNNVRRGKFQMMEDSRKALQQLFEVNYKWSALCSQFELNLIAARTP